MTMGLRSVLGNLLVALVLYAAQSLAGFTNSFDGIASGSTVLLAWDGAQAQQYPLYITAQVIDKGGDGFSANAYQVNITTGVSGTSYAWTGAPYPLRWIRGGLYQLELRSTTGDGAPLAKSPFFSISKAQSTAGSGSSAPSKPTLAETQNSDAPGISKAAAIGLGVAVGVPSIAATVIVGWCLRKRQRRAAMERRRLKRSEFVIS